jgi:two-component system cell cycle response regulator
MTERTKDDLETTRVANADKLRDELRSRSERDRAYLVVLAGTEVGKMYKLGSGETTLGRSHRADVRIDDDSISRLHAKVIVDGQDILIEDLGSSNGTLVNGERVTRNPLTDGDKIRLGETTILKFTFHDRLDESFVQKMYDAALRCPLTKAYNKKYLLDQLVHEVSYAKRHKSPLSLIMFDLDHFKRVNDTYGHVAGDQVLIQTATRVTGLLRNEDMFARYGGEEFCIVLRGTALADAGILAERVRVAIEEHVFRSGSSELRATASLGVAQYDGESEPVGLIEAADSALYAAKGAGRNRVLLKYPTA